MGQSNEWFYTLREPPIKRPFYEFHQNYEI